MKHSSPGELAKMIKRAIWLFLVLFTATSAVAKEPSEYQVKAVFLYQFANFVEWPAKAFARSDAPLIIGLLGEEPFGIIMDETVRNIKVGNRKLEVRRYKRRDDVTQCHILFVSRSEKETIPQVLAEVRDKSILTVSETEKFASAGGMINFIVVEASVRFEINVQAVERAGLKPSAKLLAAAKVIKSGDSKPGR